MDLTKSDTFTIKVGEQLILHNSRFPYPPFRWYDVVVPEGVQTKSIDTSRHYLGDGGASSFRDVFTFMHPGTYQLRVARMKYGSGTEEVESERVVSVKVLE